MRVWDFVIIILANGLHSIFLHCWVWIMGLWDYGFMDWGIQRLEYQGIKGLMDQGVMD